MRKTLIWLPVVLLMALLTACGASSDQTVVVTDEANGTTVALRPGQTLVVRLEANPTTGYTWELGEVDRAVPVGEAGYTPSASDQQMVGSGGTAEWRFEAVGSGTTVLTLHYLRPWEPNTEPAKTFSLTVNVAK